MLVAAFTLAIAVLPGIAGLAAAPVFADDFESGALGTWTQSSRLAVQRQLVFGGAWGPDGSPPRDNPVTPRRRLAQPWRTSSSTSA